ncbi:hypothetical protein C2G38_2028164 [Gigaspora rosea]|uniref:Uncharacterized protein n=1 Tax=Gigaspora rosea TaxID=44941 RepID=A0A397W2G3_9GLOM|nr:hypothetical protein C2G38_2028164 [Gigaspora rosea]
MARFHISFIPSRWYRDKHPDPYEQPYYIAQKFNKGQLLGKPLTKTANVWYLPESDHSQYNYKIINERQFYGELWGLDTTDKENEENKKGEENEEYEDNNDKVPFDLQNP